MYVTEYRTREEAALHSAGAANLLAGVDSGLVIRAAGDAALYDDLVLTADASANKQDGPRSAIYSVLDFSNGIVLSIARLDPHTEDPDLVQNDRNVIEDAMRSYVDGKEVMDRKTFDLAQGIITVATFPRRRDPLLNAGVELRVAPDTSTYAVLLVPSYFRQAPKAITRYITNMVREGKTDINPALKDLAYANDRKKVARLLAVSAVCHILDSYDEQAQLEAQFKED